ncbi:unnamed protein product [Durusdinium trenchii]|uniref:V-type proton ATPase proteolipid subunit n=1 Tax=Durusdinium trenchii TaxID=1381693 RepID=A0ABP0SAS9_9DINO
MQPCDPSSTFFGFLGVTSALVFANMGAAYGTAKSGVGISCLGVMRPDMIMKSIIPVVMAGVLGIYGLITAVIINGKIQAPSYSAYSGYAHLGAGLTVGMSSLAAGLAIGIVGEAGVRANAQQPRLFVGMILILIFAEALGLYGLIECPDVEALGITFSISVTEKGMHKDINLIPNGSNTPVTRENLTRYLHLMANYRTNIQFQRHTAAFLSGLQKVIPVTWLKMFDPYAWPSVDPTRGGTGFDVADLRANTVLSGGYEEDSPCVRWLWRLLQEELGAEDLGRFLMFVTSCSRAPLLGFKNLNPKFCVHRVPDGERLPTSATQLGGSWFWGWNFEA